jgi:tryptophan synthase beta chain
MLHDSKRVHYVTVDDQQALEAFFKLSRYEGIIPAIESAHAIAYAMKMAREGVTRSILVNCSGRGDKDVDFITEKYGFGNDYM